MVVGEEVGEGGGREGKVNRKLKGGRLKKSYVSHIARKNIGRHGSFPSPEKEKKLPYFVNVKGVTGKK